MSIWILLAKNTRFATTLTMVHHCLMCVSYINYLLSLRNEKTIKATYSRFAGKSGESVGVFFVFRIYFCFCRRKSKWWQVPAPLKKRTGHTKTSQPLYAQRTKQLSRKTTGEQMINTENIWINIRELFEPICLPLNITWTEWPKRSINNYSECFYWPTSELSGHFGFFYSFGLIKWKIPFRRIAHLG